MTSFSTGRWFAGAGDEDARLETEVGDERVDERQVWTASIRATRSVDALNS